MFHPLKYSETQCLERATKHAIAIEGNKALGALLVFVL